MHTQKSELSFRCCINEQRTKEQGEGQKRTARVLMSRLSSWFVVCCNDDNAPMKKWPKDGMYPVYSVAKEDFNSFVFKFLLFVLCSGLAFVVRFSPRDSTHHAPWLFYFFTCVHYFSASILLRKSNFGHSRFQNSWICKSWQQRRPLWTRCSNSLRSISELSHSLTLTHLLFDSLWQHHRL